MSDRLLRTFVLAAFFATLPCSAASITRLVTASSSRLTLEGSSNLAPWRCTGTTLAGALEIAAPIAQINAVIDRIEDGNVAALMADPSQAHLPEPRFEVRIPIATLRCGNRAMERDMNDALHAERFPDIEFRFTGLRGGIDHDIDAHAYRANIAGLLMLAGVSRDVELTITAARIDAQRFRIRAEMPMRMTEFGVVPPTALFGMIKARDTLLVRFDLTLQMEATP